MVHIKGSAGSSQLNQHWNITGSSSLGLRHQCSYPTKDCRSKRFASEKHCDHKLSSTLCDDCLKQTGVGLSWDKGPLPGPCWYLHRGQKVCRRCNIDRFPDARGLTFLQSSTSTSRCSIKLSSIPDILHML